MKSYYFRWVVEAEVEEVICVPRYICRRCKLVISALFAFVVPYRHFSGAVLSKAIEDYVEAETSYRDVAGEHSDSDGVRPSYPTIWTWIELFANRAAQEMEEGPPEPSCRGRFQTTASCVGKEPGW